jgi:hypothetical protein
MAVEGHLVFNGQSRLLKLNIKGAQDYGKPDGLLHVIPCHDVGVNDALVGEGQDAYGHACKCPPGLGYSVGTPQACATRLQNGSVHINNSDDQAYGCWFTPIGDDATGDMAQHDRAGIGIHGGGSDLPDSFAMYQGWEYTFGCLRLQNYHNEQVFVPYMQWILSKGGVVVLDVVWP